MLSSQRRLLYCYAAGVPLLTVPVGAGKYVGASDILFVFTAYALLASSSGLHRGSARSALLAFVLLGLLATMVNATLEPFSVAGERNAFVFYIRVIAIYIVFFLACRITVLDRRFTRNLVVTYLWAASVACLVGIALFHLGIQMRAEQQLNYIGGSYGSTLRAGGVLGNTGDFGHMAALLGASAVTLGILFRVRTSAVLITLGIATYATYVSSSRASLLHLAVAVLLMLPVIFVGRRILILLFGLPLTVVAVLAGVGSVQVAAPTASILARLDFLNLSGASTFYQADSRFASWSRLIDLLAADPLFGIGYGLTVPLTGAAGDNSFLTVTVELGAVAGICFAAFHVLLMLRAFQAGDRVIKWASLSFVTSEVLHMMTLDTHAMWSSTPIFVMWAGVLISSTRWRTVGREADGSSVDVETPDRPAPRNHSVLGESR